MFDTKDELRVDSNPQETSEWLEALDEIIDEFGAERATYILEQLMARAAGNGVTAAAPITTPYINSIPVEGEVPYPGDLELERRLKSLIRWNAMLMVVRQNKYDANIGGHIATYQSLATLTEVGYNHFFRASIEGEAGDFVYYQGHAAPGAYSRAFLEGRLSEEHLKNFRHELRDHPGLSSYPHPWLMPDFWQFPTVSMGLGPINAIYHARFMKYMENRGIIPKSNRKIWAFLGDGEMDEPESQGALTVAGREKLDNLVFVVNCNLQRLDGPVRGNAKIVQELEGLYRGAGWRVLKVLWGGNWDSLLARDRSGLLVKRMNECVDGEYQAFKARGGKYTRENFFGKYPELAELVAGMSDDEIARLRRGGHDPHKVYQAYKTAFDNRTGPTVILAKTVKGYGMGDAGEAKNVAHQQKKLSEEELRYVWKRFNIPVPEECVNELKFFKPAEDAPEMRYLHERRRQLGGYIPARKVKPITITAPPLDAFAESLSGSGERAASTTSAFVGILRVLLKDPQLGKFVVPIVPDEARTFGMESLFRQVGIYASQGQLYKPVDSDTFLYYKESRDGQILEEGITEGGSMAEFTAAGTAYANYGVPMIPFYIYYSMFGFQRVGDLVWAFADSRGKGFLLGGTAGRTTILGEGLQHQDGSTPLLFSTVPTCRVYDPAWAYELAVIINDGIRRMYQNAEDCFYYITVYNENYPQPAMPAGVEEGILKGLYRYRPSPTGKTAIHLWGSGSILNEALKAQEILAEKFNVGADVWSVTSYTELRREALDVERWNRLHPGEAARRPYAATAMDGHDGPVVAASDYMKVLADQLAPWMPNRLVTLGTDGFGRSENREHLRHHFEIDAAHIAGAALSRLARDGKFKVSKIAAAFKELNIDPERRNPVQA
ncbi:MAG: pyruvate dehydrogenase (acetyl-transferring), homodimeric type [Acidobacteria bacterium]|nr:pyruvate dehydrogenase (acetyl-transferring), homodimeric type [Acidobacteriota bacterium]